MNLPAFAKYAWGFVFYNLLVIMWGAYVRATGSGAGCGRHWPVCNGEVVPLNPRLETLVEYSHRLTSGLALLGAILLYLWAVKAFAKGHAARKASGWTLFFMLTEGGLGAGLVLFELVAENVSMARVVSMPVHLLNTFLLLGAMGLAAWWGSGNEAPQPGPRLARAPKLGASIACLFLIGMSGAITALGDTLFPIDALGHRLADSFAAQFLIQMRMLHPAMAILTGVLIVGMGIHYERQGANPKTRRLGSLLVYLFMFQVGVGTFNVILAVPVWLQMFHLFCADLVWLSLVLLTAQALSLPPGASKN